MLLNCMVVAAVLKVTVAKEWYVPGIYLTPYSATEVPDAKPVLVVIVKEVIALKERQSPEYISNPLVFVFGMKPDTLLVVLYLEVEA